MDNCTYQSRFRVSSINSSIGYTHVLCCPCCMFFTLSFASLHKHALAHDSSQLSSYRTYTCSKCLSTSTEKFLMLEHVNIYHRNTKRPVELTEEIHTILRKPNITEELNSTKSPDFYHHKRIEWKRKKPNPSFRTYSRLQQKLKLRSRIYKYVLPNAKKYEGVSRSVMNCDGEKLIPEPLNVGPEIHNEDEPIDMTIKNGCKTENKPDESKFTQEYSTAYHNIRSHFYDAISKNPLPTGLSQSVMLRYLTSQFQSLQATKYFPTNRLMPQPSAMSHQDPGLLSRVFSSQPPLSLPKIPDNSSFNPRNLHRNNFSPFQNHILLEWYDNHKQKPYPSTDETKHLATLCGLSYPQVKKWFANKRARSSFYQKEDVLACHNHARYNLLKFPLQMSVPGSLEKRFHDSIDNAGAVSGSSQDDSLAST